MGDYLLIGDSFVRRIFNYENALRKPFLVAGKAVVVKGWSGADVRTVRQNALRTFRAWTNAVVVMQVGSNDLCNVARSPELVVEDLFNFASFLVQRCGAHRIVVCEIMRRSSSAHLRGLNLGQYNEAVDRANALLKARCFGEIVFWQHHHSVRGESKLAADGVHLDDCFMKTYERSIRSAFLYRPV
jgi:hypothetical protein